MDEKFCVDCKWHELEKQTFTKGFFKKKEYTYELHVCQKEYSRTDLVTGEVKVSKIGENCDHERDWLRAKSWNCGPEGKFWEAKE